MVNTILKEADLFCPNSVRINFTIYQIFTVSSATLLSVVSLAQATPAHADTVADPSKSTGTLTITDGTVTLDGVDNLVFGAQSFNPKGMTYNLTPTDKSAHVSDSTLDQAGWTLYGSVESDAPATLTINKHVLDTTSNEVFKHAANDKQGTIYSTEQTELINSAKMELSPEQAKTAADTSSIVDGSREASVTVNVNWTLTQATQASTFNS